VFFFAKCILLHLTNFAPTSGKGALSRYPKQTWYKRWHDDEMEYGMYQKYALNSTNYYLYTSLHRLAIAATACTIIGSKR
jgi:hypothetical protein